MTDREPVNIMGVIAFPEPDKSKRRIRFIDAAYNTLFYIPDGASIVMTRMDGSSVIRPCTYIDDYHTLVGSEVYHICEFAEAAQRTGTVYEPLDPTQLPAGAGYYEIYQIDNVGKVDYAFMRYERAKGKLRAAHYRKAFAGVLAPDMTLDKLYQKHNADTRPFCQRMRPLSESDVIVVKRGSERKAYYREKEDHDTDDGDAPAAHSLWAVKGQLRIGDAAGGGGTERGAGHRARRGQDAGKYGEPARRGNCQGDSGCRQ